MRRERRAIRAPDMTSLFDVLFILVFVSLVNVGVNHTAAEEAEAKTKQAEAALASAQASASAAASAAPSARPSASVAPSSAPPPVDLSARSATILVRIDKDGVLRAIERDGNVVDVNEPLLMKVDDPDVAFEYRGDRSRDHRICAIVVEKLGLAELSHFIVIITTPESDAMTNLILGRGINNDRLRCADEQKGFAVLAPGSAKAPGDSP